MLESGDVDDTDMESANYKKEGEICFIKLGHEKYVPFLDIGCVLIKNDLDSGPIDDKVHMRKLSTCHNELIL